MSFTLLPAVDVVDGQAVRLDQGEAGTEKSYGSPREAALKWQAQGAQWLHAVDLDAAFGRGSNHELLAEITSSVDLEVELTGGIRDDESLARALATGARRVNGEWRTRGHGWVSDGGDLWEVLERLDAAGCTRFVVTDVSKDGTLQGPNIELLREVAAATDAAVTASGGISTLDDLSELALYENEGIDSAIIGKALYEERFTLSDALAAVAEVTPLPAEEYIDPIEED